jgi:hypothetical protein
VPSLAILVADEDRKKKRKRLKVQGRKLEKSNETWKT